MESIFSRDFIKVSKDCESKEIKRAVERFNNLAGDCCDIIPLSAIMSMVSDIDTDPDSIKASTTIMKIYKNSVGIIQDITDVAVKQDAMIRNLEKQNKEILKKLDELSKKIK